MTGKFELPTHVLDPGGKIPLYVNALLTRIVEPNLGFDLDPKLRDRYIYQEPQAPSEIVPILGIQKDRQPFNTEDVRAKFEGRIQESVQTGKPIDLLTIVCPPYTHYQTQDRESDGLARDFELDPSSYNFDFSYKAVMFDLAYLTDLLRKFGATVNPKMVIGDWAFRGIDGIRASLPTDADIMEQMDVFCESAKHYADETYEKDGISIEKFSNTDLVSLFPMGMPLRPEEKEVYMQSVLQGKLHDAIPEDTRQMFVTAYSLWDRYDKKLADYTNPRTWHQIETAIPEIFQELQRGGISIEKAKPFFVNFFKLLGNTMASRRTELAYRDGTSSPVKAGFYDALMKSYEYILYGSVYSKIYPNAVNFDWNTKYPAAGLFYKDGGLDTIALDPNRFPTPKSQLGIIVIPF